ncbi:MULTISPECIES: DNA polymerase III subunit delta [unclassified Sporosarcina]|uniref:DNA polymerase III subunit delta n=1 Tax=unclassified Sporosarcina TaxID=2647733 RepID=UPI001A936E0F|nr:MULTISPECIES: DNA polymerase III subunit delta [unclassified Sporosarcina]MBO0587585.1 DNA polymerase III subunit delta [Sporosarcina sp. E16_8]MBO0602427.1 DNA polymerase III subunit delta [Sporosarcina sp. E16_3]
MIHLLYGAEAFLLHEKRQELIKNVDPFSISKLDMRETTLQTAMEDARTLDLFGDVKTLILQDCYFLTGEVPRKKIDHDLNSLLQYISNPNPQTILILMVQNEKLDKRKKVVKEVMKVAKVFEAKPMHYVQGWIKERFKEEGKTVSNQAADLMTQQLGTDLFLLNSEIQKVSMRYTDDIKIEEDMLIGILSRTLESDVFKLIVRIVRKEPSTLKILEDLYRLGEDPIKILLLIARQFRIIHQVKAVQEIGQNPSSVIKMHPYALRIAEEQAESYSLTEIQERLQTIADLDVAMKRGSVDKFIALDTMILKWL